MNLNNPAGTIALLVLVFISQVLAASVYRRPSNERSVFIHFAEAVNGKDRLEVKMTPSPDQKSYKGQEVLGDGGVYRVAGAEITIAPDGTACYMAYYPRQRLAMRGRTDPSYEYFALEQPLRMPLDNVSFVSCSAPRDPPTAY